MRTSILFIETNNSAIKPIPTGKVTAIDTLKIL